MNDQKFSELLNLYLDGEISILQKDQLLKVIAENPARAREYSRVRNLNTAMEMVLDPQALQPRDLEFKPRFGVALWFISSIFVLSVVCLGAFVFSMAISPLSDSDSSTLLSSDIFKKKGIEFSDLEAQLKAVSPDSFVDTQLDYTERLILSPVEDMRILNSSLFRLRQTSQKSEWNRVDNFRKNNLPSFHNGVSELSVARKNVLPFSGTNTTPSFKAIRANFYNQQN